MLFKQLLLASSAAAFLVVPNVVPGTEDKDGIYRTLPVDDHTELEKFTIPVTAQTHSIEVPCPECRGHNAHLKLDFAIEDSTRLVLNGFELYPNPDPWQGDLTAAVIRENGKGEDRRLGYGLAVRPEGTDEDQKLEVIGLELHIIEVGDRFVDGIHPVKVKLIKTLGGGEILIGSINWNEPQNDEVEAEEGCGTVWCHVQSVFDKAWNGVKGKFHGKGCQGMRGHKSPHHHGKEKFKGEHEFHQHGEESNGRHGHHGKFGKFGHKHHHHHEHSWSVLKHVVSYVFLPVVMGITAGVGVAVLAMFIGTLLMRVVRLIRGERQPETTVYVDRKMDIIEFLSVDDEKAGLMEHQDAPPQYEDEPSRN